MKLAVVASAPASYSETFIQAQMDHLPCVLRIYGGPVSNETLPGGRISILSSPLALLNPGRLLRFRRALFSRSVREDLLQVLGEIQAVTVRRRLRENGIDRILVNFGPLAVAFLPCCRGAGIPLYVYFHGYDAHQKTVVEKHAEAYRELGREAAGIIVVSEHMGRALKALGIPEHKIHLLRNGVDPLEFQPQGEPKEKVFFGVGRFTEKKAPYLTLAAFKGVHDRFPDARLVLAGTGELFEVAQNLAKAWGMRDSVSFPGAWNRKQVVEQMQRARAFVQHSLTPQYGPSEGDCEGTPVAVMEAMMMGLPIVSTRHAGIAEIIEDGRTGFLVEERDVGGMSRAMIRILEDPVAAKKMGDAARHEALARHTMQHWISNLTKILETVH